MISSQDRHNNYFNLALRQSLLAGVFLSSLLLAQTSLAGINIAFGQDDDAKPSNKGEHQSSEKPKDDAKIKPRQLRPGPYIPPELLDAFADEVRKQKEKAEDIDRQEGAEGSSNTPDNSTNPEDTSPREGDAATGEGNETGEAAEPTMAPILLPGDIGLGVAAGSALSPDLWMGTKAAFHKNLIANMGPTKGSNALAAIKSALLTQQFNLNENSYRDVSLLGLRLSALEKIGDYNGLAALLRLMPSTMDNAETRQIRLELMLLDGDVIKACDYSNDLIEQGLVENHKADHMRLRSFCLALNADVNALDSLMDELMGTGDVDQEFSNLVYDIIKLAQDNATLDENNSDGSSGSANGGTGNGTAARQSIRGNTYTGQLSPLILAMMNVAQITPSFEQGQKATLLVKERVLALSSSLPQTDRALLAKELVDKGVLTANGLGNIYLSLGEGQNANALLAAPNDVVDIRIDAGLYRQFQREQDKVRRFKLARKAWSRAKLQGDYWVISALYDPRIQTNEITPELGFFADIGGRMALMQGQPEKALVWFNMANEASKTGDRQAIKALINLWPLMIVSGGLEDQSFAPRILQLWQDQLSQTSVENPYNSDVGTDHAIKVEGLYAALEALDYPVGEEGWLTLAQTTSRSGGRVPPIGVWRQLIKSAKMKRSGEVLALTLNIFADKSPQLLDASVLSAIVSSMKAIELEDQARQIATEFLISLGL